MTCDKVAEILKKRTTKIRTHLVKNNIHRSRGPPLASRQEKTNKGNRYMSHLYQRNQGANLERNPIKLKILVRLFYKILKIYFKPLLSSKY